MKKKYILFFTAVFVYVTTFIVSFATLTHFFQTPKPTGFIQNVVTTVNPYKRNPLSALITFNTTQPATVTLHIQGRDGATDIVHTFSTPTTKHFIPVLGLYPDYNNHVSLTINFINGTKKTKKVDILTKKISKAALINVLRKEDNKAKYYFLYDGLVFDEQGWIRLSFNANGGLLYWMGNEFISESRIGGLTRYSMLGKELKHYDYPKGFISFTHGIGQKPNGNFLVIGSFADTTALINGKEEKTHRDFVIELDYHTGEMVNKIDLAEILNPNRSVIIPADQKDYGANDWCHINAVDYDSSDKSIIVSCRHTGMVKIDEKTKKLIWIFGPNKGYNRSGRDGKGPAISDKVLVAVDKNDKPYSPLFQKGEEANASFKWPTKTHHAAVVGNGIFSIFDNSGPIYDSKVVSSVHAHASVFFVNEKNKTVKQIWKQDLGVQSSSASSVVYQPEKGEVIVYVSDVPDKNQTGMSYGLLTRFDLDSHDVLFQASVYRGGESWFYRAEDFSFYPNE